MVKYSTVKKNLGQRVCQYTPDKDPGIEHLILPMLSITQDVKYRHHVKLHLSVFRDFWKLI